MTARSLGAIALGPSLGQSSGYYFMNLNTGKWIHRRSWTELPMPNEVIKRVEYLGKKDNQPEILIFTDKHGEELPNDLLEEEDAKDEELSYGTEFNDPIDSTTGVSEDSSVDSDSKSYNDIPSLKDVEKIKRNYLPTTPSKKVYDVSLPDNVENIGEEKLDFTEAYDQV